MAETHSWFVPKHTVKKLHLHFYSPMFLLALYTLPGKILTYKWLPESILKHKSYKDPCHLSYLTCFLLAFKYRLILYCLYLTILILLKCYIQLYPCNLVDIFGRDCVSEMKLLLLCYCCIRNTNIDNPKMHMYLCLSDSEG